MNLKKLIGILIILTVIYFLPMVHAQQDQLRIEIDLTTEKKTIITVKIKTNKEKVTYQTYVEKIEIKEVKGAEVATQKINSKAAITLTNIKGEATLKFETNQYVKEYPMVKDGRKLIFKFDVNLEINEYTVKVTMPPMNDVYIDEKGRKWILPTGPEKEGSTATLQGLRKWYQVKNKKKTGLNVIEVYYTAKKIEGKPLTTALIIILSPLIYAAIALTSLPIIIKKTRESKINKLMLQTYKATKETLEFIPLAMFTLTIATAITLQKNPYTANLLIYIAAAIITIDLTITIIKALRTSKTKK